MDQLRLIPTRNFTPKEVIAVRSSLGLSVEEFAELMGVWVEVVKHWESKSGITKGPEARFLQIIEKEGIPKWVIKPQSTNL